MADRDLMDKLKLVIWDLDGTFWDGTLTEGGIQYRPDMHQAVISLSKHGIVNSIASHNDFDTTKSVLETHGIWDYFIFPEIGLGAKDDMVHSILRNAQLRPQNVMFLDDKLRIREGVLRAVPGLLAASAAEDFCRSFRGWSQNRAFSDAHLERLQHYKLLERKDHARSAFLVQGNSAHAFLRDSNIECHILHITEDLVDRIHELILRTNQLNFTKRRIDREELVRLLAHPLRSCRAIHVRDKFGDYGIAGFYAVDVGARPHRLVHFMFSCRVLHMGIEEAVYRYLSHPSLDGISGEMGAGEQLRARAREVDWVTIRASCDKTGALATPATDLTPEASRPEVLFMGPCELLILSDVLSRFCHDWLAPVLLVHRRNEHGLITHFGHNAFLRMAADSRIYDRWKHELQLLPWFDPSLIDNRIFSTGCPSVVVMSSFWSADCARYRHRIGGFEVPFDYFLNGGLDLTNVRARSQAASYLATMYCEVKEGFFEWFAQTFEFVGPTGGEEHLANLTWLCESVPKSTKIVLINLPDVRSYAVEGESHEELGLIEAWRAQHRAINEAIVQCEAKFAGRVFVLDVNRHARTREDFQLDDDTFGLESLAGEATRFKRMFRQFAALSHYQRRVYVDMALDLLRLLEQAEVVSVGRDVLSQVDALRVDPPQAGSSEAP